jgi:ribosomal protein S27E
MLALYAARIEDLGVGDFVKIDCAACHHVALLTPEALLRVGLNPAAKVLDLKGRLRCRGCGRMGLTRFGGHPESLARGAADAKNTSTVFAGVSPADGRPRPCWT